MTKQEKYLTDQCEMLAKVCMELSNSVEGLSDRLKILVQNHNELVQAVNDNTEWRAAMDAEMEMLEDEIMFTPCEDAFRDKSKDN